MVDQGWARLGARIVAERSRRWRTRRDFAHATGLSPRVLYDLETGRRDRYQPATLAAVESALGWVPGSCLRVVAGVRPRRETDPTLVRLLDVWPRLSPDARLVLVLFAEAATRE